MKLQVIVTQAATMERRCASLHARPVQHCFSVLARMQNTATNMNNIKYEQQYELCADMCVSARLTCHAQIQRD